MNVLTWRPRDADRLETVAGAGSAGPSVLECLDEELDRRLQLGRPLSIVLTAPMLPLLPVEPPSSEVLAVAADVASKVLRTSDTLGWLERDRLLVVMPDTSVVEARAAAFHWSAEMWRRCPRGQARRWRFVAMEAGDAVSGLDLVQSAYERLKVKRAA